jgi:hypothetical protein
VVPLPAHETLIGSYLRAFFAIVEFEMYTADAIVARGRGLETVIITVAECPQ